MRRSVLLATLVVGLPVLAACGTTDNASAGCVEQATLRATGECQTRLTPRKDAQRQQRNAAIDRSLSR